MVLVVLTVLKKNIPVILMCAIIAGMATFLATLKIGDFSVELIGAPVLAILMGMIISLLVGVLLTLPVSSAAICAALGLTGLAGGAAVAGCCAQMVGFAVLSFKENRWSGLLSQGLGTSMLQMPNIIKNPKIWIPACLTSLITGPVATCIFKMEMNGAAVSSGMGTCGLVGQIGVISGWFNPSQAALSHGASAVTPSGFDWLGLILVCFVLPGILTWLFGKFFRKIGWIKDGDLVLENN